MGAPGGEPEFGKVVVFGVGLIGGSFALGLKAAEQVDEVVGFGRSLATLTQALDLGIIDRVGANAGQEVADADLVLIASDIEIEQKDRFLGCTVRQVSLESVLLNASAVLKTATVGV